MTTHPVYSFFFLNIYLLRRVLVIYNDEIGCMSVICVRVMCMYRYE